MSAVKDWLVLYLFFCLNICLGSKLQIKGPNKLLKF